MNYSLGVLRFKPNPGLKKMSRVKHMQDNWLLTQD